MQSISDSSFSFTKEEALAHQLQATARIIFDPSQIASISPQYYEGGKFTFEDIKKYSTIEYISYITKEDPAVNPESVVNVGDMLNIFSFSDTNRTWKPRVNWECPTADLNFLNLQAKLFDNITPVYISNLLF